VEDDGIEPTTPCLQSRCSTNWANPPKFLVGLVGLEPTTPRLSSVCSNQLSYKPFIALLFILFDLTDKRRHLILPRKEVIQPHLPIRLPCYDFTPVMKPAVVVDPLAVSLTTSGKPHSHGVTGGVYKTRERIHRSILICDY
jgi:hypothetical protein